MTAARPRSAPVPCPSDGPRTRGNGKGRDGGSRHVAAVGLRGDAGSQPARVAGRLLHDIQPHRRERERRVGGSPARSIANHDPRRPLPMFRTIIKQGELGLVFRRGDFDRVLGPGAWRLPGVWFGLERIEIVDTLATRFRHALLDLLVRTPELQQRLVIVDLAEDQRALVWRDGRLFDFVGSGLFAYWNAPARVKVEVFSAEEVRFQHRQLDAVLASAAAKTFLSAVDVESHERLLVRRGGELIETLGAGRHAFWNRANVITWKAVDLREQVSDVAGQEIMTADKVTLRLNLVVAWKVADPVEATTVVADAAAAVYREAQL